jgi:hypothetical protein
MLVEDKMHCCVSTATVVMLKHCHVTLYVHYHSCYFLAHVKVWLKEFYFETAAWFQVTDFVAGDGV